MDCRWNRRLLVLFAMALAGCGSDSSTGPGPSAAVPSDPAGQTAHHFLEAIVQGDTAQASQLLTPLAVERIAASGKPLQLPGLAGYTFRVGEVRYPAEGRAFVQCMGTDRSAHGQPVEEEFCWLMTQIDGQWRVAAISFTAGPKQTLMIYSFENPERGSVPAQQFVARPGQSAAASPPSAPASPPAQALSPSPSPPYSAQQTAPTTYR